MESRIKNTKRNLIYTIIFQVIRLAFIFLNRIVFVNKLGAVYLGINGLFTNLLGFFSLADLGLTTTMMYSLYKPLAEKDEKKIAQYLQYFKKLYNYIALSIFIIGIIFIPFLKYLVNLPEDIPHIYLYYILILLNSVISYLFVYKTTLLSADQKMYVINKYDTIFQFILFILQILVLLLTGSFVLYLIVNIFCTFFSNLLKVQATKKIYPHLSKFKDKKNISKKERKKIFENLSSLFLYKIGGVIQTNTDSVLISIFVGTVTLGYYSNYSTIILSVTAFLTMIFTALKSSVGNYVVKKEVDDQFNMFNILEVYNFWLVGFCSICFLILIPDFIKICFGDEYVLSNGLLICAVLNFYTSNIRQVLWIYRETTAIFKKTKYVTLVTAIINVFLSIILGKFLGLIGIVAATIISRMIYAWWKEPQVLFNDYFKKNSVSYILNYIKRLILISIMYIFILTVCDNIIISNIYFSFILKGILCTIISGMIFLIIYRKSNAFNFLKTNILKR